MVSLEHIGQRFDAGTEVLSDVSLDLEAGGFHFLTGPSGAGKTALLRIICLADLPSQGRLSLFGSDTSGLGREARAALRRRIGIVFQDCRLVDRLSVADNVALPLRLAGAAEEQIRGNLPELLAWLGLADRAEAPAGTLPRSERQRVAIARAIVHRPELLVADEPAGHGDEQVALLLVRVFEQLNRLGTTVLIATRDDAFAERFAHPRFQLDRGVVSALGAGSAAPGQ